MLSHIAILQINELQDRALVLARGNLSDRQEAAILRDKAKSIRADGFCPDEYRKEYADALVEQLTPKKISEERYQQAFHKYVLAGDKTMTAEERRDLLAGSQSISYTKGPQGGYTVPIKTETTLLKAMAQIDPVLSNECCDFQVSDTATFEPTKISGYDLSSISASLIAETVQQTAGAFPAVLAKTLRSNLIYKASLSATFEAEDDVPGVLDKMATAFGVALGRAMSSACTIGNGTSEPQGVLTALTNCVYTTTAGHLTATDISDIFFSLDRFYRNQEKTGWVMSDSVYQRVRQAIDGSGRPLLSLKDGAEVLMGKRVWISPSLPAVGGSIGLNSEIIFGDLSAFHIRMSKPVLARSINSSIVDVTSGRALYTCRARIDSVYTDFSAGNSVPPLVCATVLA